MNREILATLLYFDLFKHPLTAKEILQYNRLNVQKSEIDASLKQLLELGIVYKINQFYMLSNNLSHVERRLKANEKANQKLKTAQKFTHIISRFPFVLAIFLSGSISKGVMYPDSDIDYFIITKKGRLWVTKLLLTFFKKIILLNSYRNFCINYFITENALEIEEKNHFTATEIVTIVPVYGYDLYRNFMKHNNWVEAYYPNFPYRDRDNIIRYKNSIFKKMMQFLFDNKIGSTIDNWYMDFTWKRYWKKYKNTYGESGVQVAFKSNPNTSKVHPNHYQRKFLERYKERIKLFEKENALIISND